METLLVEDFKKVVFYKKKNMITVILSAELFQGFSLEFPNEFSTFSLEEQSSIITAQFKQELIDFLMQKNLYILKEKVEKLTIHLHDTLKPDSQAWACDHPH